MWDELSANIKTFITSNITGVDAAAVYDYEASGLTKFPNISITPSEAPAEFADTQRDERTYTFSIKCYQERKEFGPDKADEVLRKLVDELINAFGANRYLHGEVLLGRGYAKPIPSRWAYVQTEQVDVRMAEILLACVVIQ